MPIARFINSQDLMRIHNERNPHRKITYKTARWMKKYCREQYEKEYGKVVLYDDRVIPLAWYEMYFGEDAFSPKKAKKKDTLPADQSE